MFRKSDRRNRPGMNRKAIILHMRLFFGLQLDPQTCLDIDHWFTKSLPPMTHPVPWGNFHITLVFLGKADDRRLERLSLSADEIRCPQFELTLDESGFWNKPGIFWLGTTEVPMPLLALNKKLKHIASRTGFSTEKRSYQPHVSLARRCKIPPPAAIEPPDFHVTFDHFSLCESVSTRSGVRYDTINNWSLAGRVGGS